MPKQLYYNTVSNQLKTILHQLMRSSVFKDFRLVGGTALSLQIGHRISEDIDLFTDLDYGNVDFMKIDAYFHQHFKYVDSNKTDIIGFGKSYFVGNNAKDCIKIDVYYADNFIQKPIVIEGVRMATIEEIIAMKMDVISRGGRKKDFWDIHELINTYSFQEMLSLHKKRHPYTHDKDAIHLNFIQFEAADNDFDPICLKEKHWELIKLDLLDFMNG